MTQKPFKKPKQKQAKNKKHEKQTVKTFKLAIKKGKYPPKCLTCLLLGIRWCKYWKTGFNCEDYEIGEIEEISQKFR